jgi:O-antigen/teichoic acid export membrane protein
MRRIFTDRILGPGVVSAAFKVAGVGISFLFMKEVTEICGAEGWGLFSICYTVALLAVSVARLGVDTALVKTIGQASALGQYHRIGSALRQSTLAVFAVACMLAAMVWVLAPTLAEQFGKPVLGNYLRIAALWIPFWAPLFLFTESLRGLGRTAAYMFFQNNLPYIVGALFLLPVVLGYLPAYSPDTGLVTYGLGLALSSFIAFWVLRLALHRVRRHPLRGKFPIRTLQRTALPILSTYLLVVALGMADVLLLGYLSPSAAETGVYALALRLSFLMLMPVQALGAVTAAGIAGQHAKKDYAELAATLRRTGRIVRAATIPLWAGLCVLSPWIMQFFGDGFVMGWPIVVVLASNQLFNALCGPTDVLLQMTGQERIYRNLLALALVINIVANIILIPPFGMWGAAIAHSLTMFSWNLIGVWRIKKVYGIWLLRVW